MSSTTLLRLSGLALLLAGVLLALAIPFHPSDTDPQALLRSAWVPVHTVFAIAVLLSLFGLLGLYLRLRERSGWLGLLGFALLFTGSAFILAVLFFEAFVAPAIASSAAGQALLDPAGPLFGGTLKVVLVLVSSIFSLGCLLFCIAILRSGTAARFAHELRNEAVEELIPDRMDESRAELKIELMRDGRNKGKKGEKGKR